ncbi:ABC transporter substrate-binding protein [Thermodesulfobacteriota bacterium]
MKNLKSLISIIAGVTLVLSLALGVWTTSAAPTEPTPKYGGTMTYITAPSRPLIGWPPDLMMNNVVIFVQSCLETLLRADAQGNVYPWLAESYKVADDRRSITFTLRKGIKFHDGSGLNAEVVKWNLDNMIKAKLKRNWASVDIIDDYTVRVTFKKWLSTSLLDFNEGIAPPLMISKAAFDKNGLDWVRRNPVGTGPFKFVSFTPDVSFKAVKNPDYWVKGKPYLDAVEFKIIGDQQTAKMLMQAGEGDITNTMLGKSAADYAAMGLNVQPRQESVWVLVPDTANADSPWANKKVREAAAYAIDREAIAKSMGFGYWKAPYQIPPRASLAYDPNFKLVRKYDPKKAKQLLTEAGYADGFKTTIIGFPFSDRNILLILQAQLAKVGIQVKLTYTDMSKWVPIMFPGQAPANSMLFTPVPRFDAGFMGGTQFLFNRLSRSWERTPDALKANKAALSSPTIDVKLVRTVNDIFIRDALLIPVHEGGQCRVKRPYVMESFDQRGYILFWDIEDTWLNK